MGFLAILIKRGAISVAIALLFIVLGLFSLKQISIRMFPKTTQPIVNISTVYPGASANVVKGFITSRLENAITGLEDIDYISATSTKGSSMIAVHLIPNANVDSALMRLQEKVNEQKGYFPTEVIGPNIEEESHNNSPTVIFSFTSHAMPRVQVAEYLRRVIEPK